MGILDFLFKRKPPLEPVSLEYFLEINRCAYPDPLVELISDSISKESKEKRTNRRKVIETMACELLEKYDLGGHYDAQKEAVHASNDIYDLIPYNQQFVQSKIGGVNIPTAFKFGGFMNIKVKTKFLNFAVDYVNNLIELYKTQPWEENSNS